MLNETAKLPKNFSFFSLVGCLDVVQASFFYARRSYEPVVWLGSYSCWASVGRALKLVRVLDGSLFGGVWWVVCQNDAIYFEKMTQKGLFGSL